MVSHQTRIFLGFLAAVISVLIFQQAMWAALHTFNLPSLRMPPPYPSDPVPPFGVPKILSLCFWGGIWGAAFAVIWRGSTGSYLFGGMWLGVAAVLFDFFVVAPLKGIPIGGGSTSNWVRLLLVNGAWGVGVGILLPRLLGETAMRAERETP